MPSVGTLRPGNIYNYISGIERVSYFVLTLQVNVHPAELALESLPRVALHDLGADVAGGDVLVAVLCELVGRLQDGRGTDCRRRPHAR